MIFLGKATLSISGLHSSIIKRDYRTDAARR
jgi:hypothetical protein